MVNGKLRPAATFLLVVNFIMYVVVLGICGWAMNRIINYGSVGYGQNAATPYLIISSLIAGTVGAVSCLYGLNHVRCWGTETLHASAAAAAIAWSLTILAMGFACKHIKLHTHYSHSDRLKTLEAFIIILSGTMILYIGTIHGAFKRG